MGDLLSPCGCQAWGFSSFSTKKMCLFLQASVVSNEKSAVIHSFSSIVVFSFKFLNFYFFLAAFKPFYLLVVFGSFIMMCLRVDF